MKKLNITDLETIVGGYEKKRRRFFYHSYFCKDCGRKFRLWADGIKTCPVCNGSLKEVSVKVKWKRGAMQFKKTFVFTLCAILLIGICACSNQSAISEESQAIIDNVLTEFNAIAEVPRPSGHEEKIANYLCDWAKKHNLNPIKDQVNNVIFDVPATNGMENKERVVLQCHSDMVFAQTGNKKDPLNTPIKVKNNGRELTADGTSLGADDGIGCSIALCVADGKVPHGPLRLVFTTSEETDQTGAINLDSIHLEGINKMINLDNENCRSLVISSASSTECSVTAPTTMVKPTKSKAVKVKIDGLKGGHSGLKIQEYRINAITALSDVTTAIKNANVEFEYTDFIGGHANNAIPAEAEITLVYNPQDKSKIEDICTGKQNEFREKFASIDPDVKISTSDTSLPDQVVSNKDYNAVVFANKVINGVYTMSTKIDGLVESSSNLGVVSVNKEGVKFNMCIRSSETDKLEEICSETKELCKSLGLKENFKNIALSWPASPYNELTKIVQNCYRDNNKEEIKTEGIHAGSECGNFVKKKPDLNIACIGPTIHNCHSVQETLELDSVPITYNLLARILMTI